MIGCLAGNANFERPVAELRSAVLPRETDAFGERFGRGAAVHGVMQINHAAAAREKGVELFALGFGPAAVRGEPGEHVGLGEIVVGRPNFGGR